MSPPGQPTTYITDSKKLEVFLGELKNNGIANGKYNCSGTYNGQAVNSIEFVFANFGSRTQVGTTVNHHWVYHSSSPPPLSIPYYSRFNNTWGQYVNKFRYSIILRNNNVEIYNGYGDIWSSSTDYSLLSSVNSGTVEYVSGTPPSSPVTPTASIS